MDVVLFGQAVGLAVVAGFSGWLGAYFSAYWKKKGEQAATHDDLENVLKEVRAVTKTTEEIKADISAGLWDRQKRWEIKREVLFEVVLRIWRSYSVLKNLDVVLRTEIANSTATNLFQMKTKVEENAKWFEAVGALDESGLFIDATCHKSIGGNLWEYRKLAADIAAKIYQNDVNILKSKNIELLGLRNRVLDGIRKELEIDPSPQSTEFSAAPSPD
jgi:hypothetical protein